VFISAQAKIFSPYGWHTVRCTDAAQFGFDFDFNILTAFIRLGRARPQGGVPSLLLFEFDFDFDFLLF